MKKIIITILLLLSLLVLAFLIFSDYKKPAEQTAGVMTESEARLIAEKNCIKGGEALSAGVFNENSKTWWFDANLNSTKPGCNPACVVSAEAKTAEINWRCTGLIPPSDDLKNASSTGAAEKIKEIFALKYSKYAKTLSVKIVSETGSHVRGSVSFVEGQPGGIFLAAKVDGEWQIVFDGNGAIPCDLAKYDFPASMLADCAEQ